MSCCGVTIQAHRNADLRKTYAPRGRNYTLSGFTPLMQIRDGSNVLLTVSLAATANGSVFSIAGDALVLTIKKEDLAALVVSTDARILAYDIVLSQGGFEDWFIGGDFVLLALNDASVDGDSDVSVELGGQQVDVTIMGGNISAGASVLLADLNSAAVRAEEAAQAAEEAASQVNDKADTDGSNITGSLAVSFRNNVSVRAKAQYPVVSDLLATAGDGITNVGPTLARTDVDFFTLPPGNFLVSTNTTITKPVYFAPGSIMTINSGVTVTFSGAGQVTSDCRRQVFYGTGAVLGLRFVDETWFVGDKIYALDRDYITNDVTTPLDLLGPNADAELQRAANACRQNAKYQCHSGVLSLSGDVSIAFNDQVEIRGDIRTSLYMWTSLKTNGFALNQQRSKISGVWFRKYAMDQFATEGVGLYINSSQPFVDNIMVSGAFIGIQHVNHAGGFFDSLEIYNAKSAAFSLVNVNDTVLKGFLFNGGNELGSFTSPSAGWTSVINGDVITGGTSGAKFVVGHVTPVGKLYISKFYQNAQQAVIGEVFTNDRTGATATLSAYEYPHAEAGIKLEQTGFSVSNFTEGTFVSSGDIINGYRSLLILGSGVGYREGPSFNNFTAVFFDSALAEGIKLDKTDGVRFVSCWVSARLNGFNIQDSRQISFNGCEIRDSAAYGGLIGGAFSAAIDFTDCAVTDNRSGVPGTTGSQITVGSEFVNAITIKGGRWGKSVSTRHSTDTAIEFLGTSAKVVALGVTFRSTRNFPIGGLFGLPQRLVAGCDGARMVSRVAGTILTGQSSVTLSHGLNFTPDGSIAVVQPNSANGWGGGASAYVSATTSTTYTVTLLDKDGNVFNATKNMNFICTFDQSYNAIN